MSSSTPANPSNKHEKQNQDATDHVSEIEERLKKRQNLLSSGINPYDYVYESQHTCKEVSETFNHLKEQERADNSVSLRGRIVAKRGHGKASFGNIQDHTGQIQTYISINTLEESLYQQWLNLDVGDIVGITGIPFVTKRGQLSLDIQSYKLLTKSLRPLPEKYHGLQDKELRYRQRYVDLIANPEVKDVFVLRAKATKAIRDWLSEQGFYECETPVLHSIYGGAAARPFKTHHNQLDQPLYLRIALELHLKRLIVGGFDKVFEIGRVFRNEGVSWKHNPEYTLLELYQAYADYQDMMHLTETLLNHLVLSFCGDENIIYQEKSLSFALPFKRITMAEVLQTYADVDMNGGLEHLKTKAQDHGLKLRGNESKGELIALIYDKCCEHRLIEPTFVYDYPWETSPLAKRHRDNPDLVERFELIINGMEIANAFTELNDPVEQKQRFEDQLKAKDEGYEDAHEMDEDFIEALSYGMPPTGGLGIGIDRVMMLLSNMPSIRDVLLFPHLKSK